MTTTLQELDEVLAKVVGKQFDNMLDATRVGLDCAIFLQAHAPEIRAALELQAKQSWQPIETAPKDGRTIILSRTTSFLGFWDAHQGAWCDNRQFFRDPTHWMPLPAPPAQGEQ